MKFTTASIVALTFAGAAHAQVNVAASSNGGFATQSSTLGTDIASRANDGNRDGNYSVGSVQHTQFEPGAWWDVQFTGLATVGELIVFNRTDTAEYRINTFTLRLFNGATEVWSSPGNTFVADISAPSVNGMTFHVGGITADRARISLDGAEYLHIAEFEAWTSVPAPGACAMLCVAGLVVGRRRR